MSQRYYTPSPLALGPFCLEGAEAHHLAGVSRVRPDDLVCLFNGDGQEYQAIVKGASRRQVRLEIMAISSPHRELDFVLEVAAPLPKGDRCHFLVEKLTELGVTRFVPFQSLYRGIRRRRDRPEKLERYVIEASKQCGRNKLMKIEGPTDWQTFCTRAALPWHRFLAHPGRTGSSDGAKRVTGLPADRSAGIALAVGPEGGFTSEEVAAAVESGWRVVDLGPRMLRVETAALVLAAWGAGVCEPTGQEEP
jgi:16S rRNA (uracil1498-N3)-methyltransferase